MSGMGYSPHFLCPTDVTLAKVCVGADCAAKPPSMVGLAPVTKPASELARTAMILSEARNPILERRQIFRIGLSALSQVIL